VHGEQIVGAGPSGRHVVFGCPDGAFGCIDSVIVGWCQLEVYTLLLQVVLNKLGTFIVKAVELGRAASFGKGLMDAGNGGGEGFCFPIAQGAQQDAFAVIVIHNQDVVVARAGGLGESACLVSVHTVLGLCGSQEACVSATVVLWLGREVKGVSYRPGSLLGSFLGAPSVLPDVVQVAHSGGLGVWGVFSKGIACQPREWWEVVLLYSCLQSGSGRRKEGPMGIGH
jgi:hypothetical protein